MTGSNAHAQGRRTGVRRTVRRWRRRTRRRIRYLRHHRKVRIGFLSAGGLLLLGAAWIVITGLLARSQLSDFQTRLLQVKTLVAQGRVQDAKTAARDLPAMAERAERLTSGPAWWIADHVPYLGRPVETVRVTTEVTRDLGVTVVPRLLSVASDINPASLRGADGDTIRLAPLVHAAPDLQVAARSLTDQTRRLSRLDDTWLGAVDSGRTALESQLDVVRGYVSAAARATDVLPRMLGMDGRVRRYFIGLQNESELRGTGGIPGAFAIARTQNGKITFERFASDAVLLPSARNNIINTGLNFGRSYNSLYAASSPTREFNDSNVSPHFPYAARIWAAMYQKEFGVHIDGAIAVDPTALSYFLAATGPAVVPGSPVQIDAANVVELTQSKAYTLFPDNNQRRKYLVSILRAAAKKLISGAGAPYNLVQATSRSSSEQRLLAWSSDPAVQRRLEETTYAGDIAARGRPLSAVILNNAAAGKLDYYLDRSVNYLRTGCGSERTVTVSISLTNNAPASGLPPYVTDRLDKFPPRNRRVGDSRTVLDYYATGGAKLRSARVDGKPATISVHQTLGRTVFRSDLELPRGRTRTVMLQLDEPAGTGPPQIWRQPGVVPLAVRSDSQSCR